jgi:hypothetical protein
MYKSEYNISLLNYKNFTHDLLSPSGFTKFTLKKRF